MRKFDQFSFIFILVFLLFQLNAISHAQVQPPYTNYCEMLARNIQGKKHGFLAGNLLYYVGGQANAEWDIIEHETLGFTHGFFRDGRSRGHGIVTNAYGSGHDFWGWEFYRKTKIAYGSIISGIKYTNPIPSQMIWRPDKTTCVYQVGGITVTEEKFITENDVLVSIITSNQPVTLEFEGNSFVNTEYIPTWDGDPAGVPFSQDRNATASFDTSHNAIHIMEDGTAMVKPNWGIRAAEGNLMYDGMHVILSSTADISATRLINRDGQGRQVYSFRIPCNANGVAIAFAMGDDYDEAVTRVDSVLSDPQVYLQQKTEYMNDLLNYQIPYFRCSDTQIEQVYYYLWSLYFMYFLDVGEGWEKYPHTQTAVNNFLGLFAFDAYAYIPVGSWTANKEYFAYGNALTWKFLLPYKHDQGMLPDNLGIAWYSPVWIDPNGHVEGSWQIYEHSGDLAFLDSIYTFYRELFWQGTASNWGIGLNALDILKKMALESGPAGDTTHWQALKDDMVPGWYAGWDGNNFYGSVSTKDIWNLASMMYHDMPDEWARKMVNNWVMNAQAGYLDEVPLKIRAHDSPQIPPFNVSTLSTYLAVEGMFRHHCDEDAIFCTLGHINGMLKDYGFPVTPEAWDQNNKPWGDMYYNWDDAMLLLLIEQIGGIHYSLMDSTFIVCDHLPKNWDFQEWYVPVMKGSQTEWTRVRIERNETASDVGKSITVSGNSQGKLYIQPWLEDRELLTATPTNYVINKPAGHASFSFAGVQDASVTLSLGLNQKPTGIFLDDNKVAENSPVGTMVDVLRSKDRDAGDSHSYSFARAGDNADSASFIIAGDTLETSEIFDYETKNIYHLGIRSTDTGGSYYEEYFNIRVEDLYEGTDSTVTDTLVETFTGPEFDQGQAPEGYWTLENGGGTFNNSGQYTISTSADFVGFSGEIDRGNFEARIEVSHISWLANFSKVIWEINDGDGNAFVYFVEKGDTWMTLLVDLVTQAGNTRPVQVSISTPSSVKFKIQWSDETKVWRVWYGLNGSEPTIEPPGSPITTYPVTSQSGRSMAIGVGKWNEGSVTADLDYFEIIREIPYTPIDRGVNKIPTQFSLSQNYPNPFNPTTTIEFALPQTEWVTLQVFNILGQQVITLVSEKLNPGVYRYDWKAQDIPSGIYYCRLQSGNFQDVKKLILLK